MKNMLLIVLSLMMLAPLTEARRKKAKAGKIIDNVYHDSKYNFSLTMHKNWKAKIRKDKNNVRLTLTQKDYAIPPDYLDAPDYTKVPKITIYVDTCSLGAPAFLDSLIDENYKSKQKKNIIKEFDFLQEQEIIPRGRGRWNLKSESGIIWKAMARYMKEVQTSAGSVGGKRVRAEYGGAIAGVKRG